jgi:predicted DNA-binding transcriptional regulator AlpA
MSLPSVSPLVDIPTAQALLGGVSRSTIYVLARAPADGGKLSPVKIGRRTFFRRQDVEALAQTGA